MTRRARDILLDILRDEGITHVFGNPGSTEMPLMDALVDAPDITYVLGLQEATAVGMADGWALAIGQGRLRQPACDGRARQRDGRAGRLQGERDAARRHRGPAGHAPPDDRAVALRRSRRARRAGDQMGEGGAARRGRRPGAAPRLRHRAHAAVRAGVPVAADGRARPGGQRPDASGLRAAEARRLARRGAARREARRPRSGKGRRAARRRSAGFGERGPGRVRRSRRLSGLGNAAHLARGVSLRASLLGGRDEAGFRLDARAFRDRRRRSCWSAGAPSSPIPIATTSRCREGVAVLHVADNPEAFGREHAADMALLGDIGATLAAAAERLARAGRQGNGRGAARRARRARSAPRRDALRAEILAESASAPLSRRRRGARRARRAAGATR